MPAAVHADAQVAPWLASIHTPAGHVVVVVVVVVDVVVDVVVVVEESVVALVVAVVLVDVWLLNTSTVKNRCVAVTDNSISGLLLPGIFEPRFDVVLLQCGFQLKSSRTAEAVEGPSYTRK